MGDTAGTVRGTTLTDRAILWRAIAAGAALWALSPLIAGRREPWDSPVPYYWISLIALGAGFAWYARRRTAMKPIMLGLYIGQLAWGLIALGVGNLLPLGLIALAFYLIPAYVAARVAFWFICRDDRARS